MGMYSYVIGIKAPDAKFQAMKRAYEACVEAGVPMPKAVDDFFNGEKPDPEGVTFSLKYPCCVEWGDDNRSGYTVELSKLPKGTTHVRFVNSW